MQIPQFQGSAATVKFIRVFDHLFDVPNSRSPLAKGYQAPYRVSSKNLWDPFFDEAYQYILALKIQLKKCLTKYNAKLGLLDFWLPSTFDIDIRAVFHKLVEAKDAPLKYLLTYKLSQDHLQLLFVAVRAARGFNNNPTTQQFTAAYKRLLLRNHIQGGKRNCVKRDPIKFFCTITDTVNVKKNAYCTN